MAKYLITGGAGFIGSNLVKYLLAREQEVVVLDNLSTGAIENIEDVLDQITFIEGDLRDYETVLGAVDGVDAVSHQGALGSVPRSVDNPTRSHDVNVNGTLNVLEAMRASQVRRIVFAASSSAFGKNEISPKVETMPAMPISPYAASKTACEAYMQAYSSVYGIEAVSLRYFNVFGPGQSPEGVYAHAIPRFIAALMAGKQPVVFGDGEQSRDFCFIENVCSANWLAIVRKRKQSRSRILYRSKLRNGILTFKRCSLNISPERELTSAPLQST